MAHYRDLDVRGVDYQFNIGKRFVDIRLKNEDGSKRVVPKEEIGFAYRNETIVSPAMIRDYLLGIPRYASNYFPTCKCTGVTKYLRPLPYDAEILEKITMVVFCQNCLDLNAEDI